MLSSHVLLACAAIAACMPVASAKLYEKDSLVEVLNPMNFNTVRILLAPHTRTAGLAEHNGGPASELAMSRGRVKFALAKPCEQSPAISALLRLRLPPLPPSAGTTDGPSLLASSTGGNDALGRRIRPCTVNERELFLLVRVRCS